jgi:sugar/nucleoside kinase (ribokinase family)
MDDVVGDAPGDTLCFGNLQLDILCRTVTVLPPPGALRRIDGIDAVLSGNGGNVAATLGRLGVRVDIAGYVGADLTGDQLRAALVAQGVGTAALSRHSTEGTGTSVIALAPDGERSVLYVNGANALFDLDAIPDEWLRGRHVVSVGSVFVLPRFTGVAVARLFSRARAHGATTVLNVCWDDEGRGLPFLAPALAEADIFILSAEEGRQLTGRDDPADILRSLEACARGAVVVTLGADGCLVRGAHGPERIPAIPVAATDCTGAGDSFVAGFIAGLITGRARVACAQLGCHVAAYAVTGPTAYLRVPPLIEFDDVVGAAPTDVADAMPARTSGR